MNKESLFVEYSGICTFHSETGSEGGYWAFQDEKFIKKIPPDYGVWGEVYDQKNPDRKGVINREGEILKDGVWLPWPDPMRNDPDYGKSSLFNGELGGDKDADRRLMERYTFRIKYSEDQCNEMWGEGNWHIDGHIAVGPEGERVHIGGTPFSEPSRPYGAGLNELMRVTVKWNDGEIETRLSNSLLIERWSYEGLHILENGDKLTIYDKNDLQKVIWKGAISLNEFVPFTESAGGLWIHADQESMDRDIWARYFFDQYPSKLFTSRYSQAGITNFPKNF